MFTKESFEKMARLFGEKRVYYCFDEPNFRFSRSKSYEEGIKFETQLGSTVESNIQICQLSV